MRALACVLLIACGGSDDGEIVGDPLIQSTLTAEFNNRPWTPAYGFGRIDNGNFRVYIGSEKISCADEFDGVPRNGSYAALGVTGAPMVGTFSSTAIQFVEVVDKT